MTKEEKKDEMKNRISMALKDPILQQGFEIICKNLAELEKENEKLRDKVEMLNFFYEGNGFKKRNLHTAIMIADYIDKLEKEKEETRKKIIDIFANDEAQQGELWKACGLRLVGWNYDKNQLDDGFMMLYGVSN